MTDANANILIQAELNDRLSAALQRINGQLSNTIRSLNGLKASSQGAVGATNAVGAAITQLSRQSNSLNGSLRSNALSQQALSVAFRNSGAQATALTMQLGRLRSAGLDTGPIRAYVSQLRAMDAMQKQVGNSMRAMQFQKMGTQLNAFSQRMTNAGTRITMGLTLPLVAFFRIGFQSFKALDKQVIRSSKLMSDSFDDTVKYTEGAKKGFTDLGYALKTLGDGLDGITAKWGVSRELVQGLAGDFAELGISAPETLSRLTELTVEFEKLGNIDITQAQSTIQAMFQTISRIRTDKGLDVSSAASLKQMTQEIDGAIAFFNFAENKTTLSLNNIAEAFPEVTAAATSFGLNMQTTAAMLVPMIGAAFQTGASANSIKVSLQRMVATTKQNSDMLKDLSGVLGEEFAPSLDVSANGVMGLINNYDLLLKKFGQKGALQFMSKLFGVRQGPRMEVAVAQMNKYSKSLKLVGTQEQKMAEGVERSVNAQLKLAGYGDSDMVKIRNLKDITDLTLKAQEMNKDTGEYTAKALRIQEGQKIAMQNLDKQSLSAGKQNLDAQGKIIVDNTKKQAKQNKIGEEFNRIQTETGKLLTGQLYGKALTEKNKKDELERVRKSIEVQYGIARENVKSISRELVTVFGDVLQVLNPILKKISAFIRDLSPQTKKIIGVVLLALVAIGPLMRTIGAIGQLGAMFAGARAAGIKRFRGNVVELNQSLMQTSDIALRLGGKFQKFGQDGKIFTSRKDARRLEKLAPIIAKQDRGETLTAKETAKGGKYVRQLTGGKAVASGTALLPAQNLKGLDQVTRDYVKSLDPLWQANKIIDDAINKANVSRTSIASRAAQRAQRVLNIRGSSNQPFYPTPTGAPIPPQTPIYPTPTGAAIPSSTVAAPSVLSLRDILTQILASLQAIQACVCNAKAATTGRPSPAASGAPTNAPPSGAAAPSGTSVTIRPRAATGTGASAPAGVAATVVNRPDVRQVKRLFNKPATLPMVSPTVVNNNVPTPASLIPPPSIPAIKETLPPGFMNPMAMINAMRPAMPAAPSASSMGIPPGFMNPMAIINAMKPVMPQAPTPVDIKPAVDKAMHAVAETVMVSIGKKPTPPTANPIPAAVETATVEAEKTVATNVVEGAKSKGKRGRPKGSVNKTKTAPATSDVTPASSTTATPATQMPFINDYGISYAKAIASINQSVQTMVQQAADSSTKATVDFKSVGESLAKTLNLDVAKGSVTLTKESLIRLFGILGKQVPEKLRTLDALVDKEGKALNVKLEGLGKIAGSIKTGAAGKALASDARKGAAFTGGAKNNPFYVQKFNEGVSTSVGNTQTRVLTKITQEEIAGTADLRNFFDLLEKEKADVLARLTQAIESGKILEEKVKTMILSHGKLVQARKTTKANDLQFLIIQEQVKLMAVEEEIANLAFRYKNILTGVDSVKQLATKSFNDAQNQLIRTGKTSVGSMSSARNIAAGSGRRYVDVAYGAREKTDAYRDRRSISRPGYNPNLESEEIKQRRKDLSEQRLAGIKAAKEKAGSIPRRTMGTATVKAITVAPTAPPQIKTSLMPKEQFLAGQVENLKSLDEAIKAANAAARQAKASVKNLEGQIEETVNSKKRIPGGKAKALERLNEDLERAKGKADRAKAAAKAAKDEIARINAYDPANGGLPPKPVAPAKPSGGGGRVGGTSMLTDPFGMAMGGMVPRGPKAPRIGPMSLAFMDTGAVTGGVSTVYGEIQTALKIPADIMQQVIKELEVKHAQITGVGKAAVTKINGNTSAVVQAIQKSVADPANATVEEIKQAIVKARTQFAKLETAAMKATRTGVTEGATTAPASAAKPATGSASYGFGMEASQRKALAEQIKSQIIAENKAAIDFMQFESKTLEYIGRAFEIEGRGKGKKEVVVTNLVAKLKEMGIAVEKAIVTEAIAPVTAATNAVVTTSATASGASADEVAKVVQAEKDLAVAVEKSVVTAATTVEKAAVAASSGNAYLAALKVKAQSPLAPRTSGGSGAKATDATPAVAVNKPYSAPYLNIINSLTTDAQFKTAADTIGYDLRSMKHATLKQLQGMVDNILIVFRSVNASAIDAEFGTRFGGNLAKALEQVEEAIRQKLAKEAEKVKTVTSAVTAVPVAPAPPVVPAVSAIPAGFMNPMSMLNAMKPVAPTVPKAAGIPAGFMDPARMVGAMAPPALVAPARVNLREILAERLAIKASMEAEKAAMAQRIRDNVALSQAIRERKAATAAANEADRFARKRLDPTSIASVPIPARPSSRRPVEVPLTRDKFAGEMLGKTANVLFNPIKQVKMLGNVLEAVAKKVSPKRFGEQNVYKTRDYMGEARRVTFGRIADRNLQVTGRQSRIAEKDARVLAKDYRSADRPARGVRVLTQSQLPSQFRQSLNQTTDMLKAIVKPYIPKLKAVEYIAKTMAREGLVIAGQITKELVMLPKTVPVVFTKALVQAHKFAMQGIRTGIASLESMTFFQTTLTGKSLLFLAKTIERSLTKIGAVATTAGQGLVTAGEITKKFIYTAFTNPKQALVMASAGLTNSGAFIASAGKSLVSNAGAALKVAGVALEAGARAVGRGAVSVAKSAGTMAMAPVRGAKKMLVGGGFVSQGQDAAGNTIETKKGGLFGRTVTRTTDPSGMMTEQRGPGMFGRMKGGIGKGLMGGIKGLGTAAGSMSSMMLYQLGPAGMALQGPMNKVINLLTRTKAAFFGVTLPIMLVVGAIFLLKKTFNSWKDQSTGVAENFGKAFKALMAVVNMLKSAFFDFFASLFGGAENSSEATGNIGKTVSKVAETVRKFAEGFKAFFEKTILPAVYTFLSGLSLVIRSIVSFVGNLIKFVVAVVSFFRGGGDKAKEAMGNAFKGMVKAVGNAFKGILKMVLPVLNLLIKAVFKVVELIVQLLEWLAIGILNIFRYMVKGIINLSFTIVKAYVFIIDKVIDLFVIFEKAAINIALATVHGVVNVFFGILKGVVFVVQKVIDLFAMIPAGVGKGFSLLGGLVASLLRKIADKIPGVLGWVKGMLNKFADGIEGIGEGAEEAGKKAQSGLNGILDPVTTGLQAAQNKILGVIDKVGGAVLTNIGKLGSVGDTVNRVLGGIQNALLDGVDVGFDTANAFIGGFSDGIASLGDSITDWLGNLADGDDIKKGIGDSIKKAVEDGAKDPSAATAAGKSIAEAIGKGISSLKQNFYDKVVDNLGNSLGKLKDQITKALEKQKDQSLKFFDDQIAAIDALAAADAELTAEKQKQEDERLRIAERALQRDSYLKNRALAIYEGRIDDARTMALEEAKNQQDFNRETEKNAKDAQAAAKAKNVEAAKKVIENQKQVASNQFDKDLEDFQTFIENIGKNGTLTAAELTTQFNELKARADATSTGMQGAFQGYYNALPNLIARNTTPSVGFFTSSMDALIAGAQAKYGLDTGVTDPTTMLGVTNGMMNNLGTVYTNGFTNVVAPAYNDGQELLTTIATEFADPSTSNPKSAAGIYASAIANATAAVRAEFMKMKTDASSAFAEVVKGINDELRNLAISQAITDAVTELKNTGGGTSPSGGSATSPATGVTGPTAPTGYGPSGLTEAGFLKATGADKLFKLNDKSPYIKAAKAALAFYGYSGFDVNTETMGASTIKALASFQKKYPVAGNNDGNLGPASGRALGIFDKVGVQKKFMGGLIKRAAGGAVPGYTTQGVPAILHGGEYVISSKAVQNLGLGVLSQLNGLKHGVPAFNVPKPQMPSASGMNMSVTSHSTSETTQNYNFYVDNFIGEDQWFESMMKDYNVKVVPNNQKAAGLESRVVRTYNGLNRGM